MEIKLRRYPDEAIVGGVCAGIAYSTQTPVWFVRFVMAILLYGGNGFPLFVYLLLWFILPPYETPRDYHKWT
jgi:phage shock protein PspC (stress-responsive transcriptional regulator)